MTCVAAVAAGYPYRAAEPADEPPPTFTAAQLLTPAELRGPHHTLADAVRTDNYYHEFRITSDFGEFEAAGRMMLAVRLHEITALAQLDEVSKTELLGAGAGQSVDERRERRRHGRRQPGGHRQGRRVGSRAARRRTRTGR